MKYIENGALVITLNEMQRILDYAKNRAEYGSMLSTLIINKKGDKITIIQNSHYGECNSIDHTYLAR